MNYGVIKTFDVANGPSVRVSLYVSGCTHHCKDCFNEDTWDFNYGKKFTKEVEDNLLKEIAIKKRFSLLGGDPFDNVTDCLRLVKRIRTEYPETDIWCWTGYTYEQILKHENTDMVDLLCLMDVLVDGRFIKSKHDYRLKYKGSTNQRVIDIKESIVKQEVVIKEEYNN